VTNSRRSAVVSPNVVANVVIIEIAEIMKDESDVRVIGSQNFFADRQSAQIRFFSPRNIAGVTTIETQTKQ
jgi:hypothetical protein